MPRINPGNKVLSAAQRQELLRTLENRFAKSISRHPGIAWAQVRDRLEGQPEKLWSLREMETTGGAPDVAGQDTKTGAYLFCDCAAESPAGRRSFCYDQEALDRRKENKPKNSAMGAATAMGIELLTQEQYRALQKLGPVDTRTSSWLQTPPDIRALGGAIFGDYRYGTVFIYHNGAESYYAARGFRGLLRV